MVTIKKSIGWGVRAVVGGGKRRKGCSFLGLQHGGVAARLHGKKRNRVQKWSSLDASQGWTLKACFSFFHSASVEVPKSFAFSPFSSGQLLPSLGSA